MFGPINIKYFKFLVLPHYFMNIHQKYILQSKGSMSKIQKTYIHHLVSLHFCNVQ